MKSLRDASENAAVLQRLESLSGDTPPLWGRMDGAQMLAHCQKPLLVAAGELTLKRGLIGVLFGRMAKKKFVDSPQAFKPNGPTDPRFLVSDPDDFDAEQERLLRLVRRYADEGPQLDVHPFFGRMSPEDWDHLNWKHLDHHLRQFGA